MSIKVEIIDVKKDVVIVRLFATSADWQNSSKSREYIAEKITELLQFVLITKP